MAPATKKARVTEPAWLLLAMREELMLAWDSNESVVKHKGSSGRTSSMVLDRDAAFGLMKVPLTNSNLDT